MSLSRYFKEEGKSWGYDKTPTALTDELIEEGIEIHFTDDITSIPSALRHTQLVLHNTLIVFTPAIPKNWWSWIILSPNDSTLRNDQKCGNDYSEWFHNRCRWTHGKTRLLRWLPPFKVIRRRLQLLSLAGFQKIIVPTSLPEKTAQKKIFVVEADEYDVHFLRFILISPWSLPWTRPPRYLRGQKIPGRFLSPVCTTTESRGKLIYKKGLRSRLIYSALNHS